jgi:hypothetical protein
MALHALHKKSIPGHNGYSAGAADFREIARRRHSDIEARALAAHDRAIDVRFVQCALQLAATCAATMTRLAKFTGLTRGRQKARRYKGWSVHDLFARIEQL